MLVEHMLTKIGHSSEWKTSSKEAVVLPFRPISHEYSNQKHNGSIGENLFVSTFYFTVVAHAAIWLKKDTQLPLASSITSIFSPKKPHETFKHMKAKRVLCA